MFLEENNKIVRCASNQLVEMEQNDKITIRIYPNSIQENCENVFFIIKEDHNKYLFVVIKNQTELIASLHGNRDNNTNSRDYNYFLKCDLNNHNRKQIQTLFKSTVYKAIRELKDAVTPVKTAGTSYLEALKVVALMEPDLFRQILNLLREHYEQEKNIYHVSAEHKNVKEAEAYSEDELTELFDMNDARQIPDVAIGKILTEMNETGEYLFKTKIIDCLKRN